MPFITREDGEHFVIPSYRDVLVASNKSLLKKEILALSQNYGEYITLQKKNVNQYEIAFSTDTGYLLGESIWHQFNRPDDMIYCEVIPNTTEAILVIVKAGSVYLDGSFPVESIAEELVIFLTQQNNFEIYLYGDVPISKEPVDGKFSFDDSSVKSFTILENPVFPTLPLIKIYQLQLVKAVLEAHGIGVLPIKKILMVVLILGGGYYLYSMLSTGQKQQVQQEAQVAAAEQVDPYKTYTDTLNSPPPKEMINQVIKLYSLITNIPGWKSTGATFENGSFKTNVVTKGAEVQTLFNWAALYEIETNITETGIELSKDIQMPNRPDEANFYAFKEVIATLLDRMEAAYHGDIVKVSAITTTDSVKSSVVTLDVSGITPTILKLISEQLQGLPLALTSMTLTTDDNGLLTSTITLQAVGG